MRGNALLALSQYAMNAVIAVNGRAATARLSFIAGSSGIIKVITTGALHQVAAISSHIAQLLRSTSHDSPGQQRITLHYQGMIRSIGIGNHGTKAQAAVVLFYVIKW